MYMYVHISHISTVLNICSQMLANCDAINATLGSTRVAPPLGGKTTTIFQIQTCFTDFNNSSQMFKSSKVVPPLGADREPRATQLLLLLLVY